VDLDFLNSQQSVVSSQLSSQYLSSLLLGYSFFSWGITVQLSDGLGRYRLVRQCLIAALELAPPQRTMTTDN
jgi:hypothetical protein